jgi:hypothetical protein
MICVVPSCDFETEDADLLKKHIFFHYPDLEDKELTEIMKKGGNKK